MYRGFSTHERKILAYHSLQLSGSEVLVVIRNNKCRSATTYHDGITSSGREINVGYISHVHISTVHQMQCSSFAGIEL